MARDKEYYAKKYEEAKAKGDTADMDAAHKAADAIRGYETTTVKNAAGSYEQVPVKPPVVATVPTAPTTAPKQNTSSGGNKSSGTKVSVAKADGTSAMGTVVDGKTVLDNGQALKQGDVVNVNGTKYTYDEKARRGLTDQETLGQKAATAPTTIQPPIQDATQAGKRVEVIRSDGTKVMGTVVNGKTTLDGGQGLKDGDAVTINGTKYVYNSTAGKGVATGAAANAPADLSVQGKQVSVTTADGKTKTGYVVNGKTYYGDGSTLKQDDSVVVNGTRYTYVDALGRGLTSAEYENYMGYPPPVVEAPAELGDAATIEELIKMVSGIGIDAPELEEFLSWAEAQALASERYNPAYNKALKQQLSSLDTTALKTGFFGQLPTEALKQQAVASAENEKYSAIMDLARGLMSDSQGAASTKFEAELATKESKLNQLLALLGVQQDERQYADDLKAAKAKAATGGSGSGSGSSDGGNTVKVKTANGSYKVSGDAVTLFNTLTDLKGSPNAYKAVVDAYENDKDITDVDFEYLIDALNLSTYLTGITPPGR